MRNAKCRMLNDEFNMQINTEPHEITGEMHVSSCDLAWFSNSNFKFCIAHLAFVF